MTEFPLLTDEHFRSVLEQICRYVFQEKGVRHHGEATTGFEGQDWVAIARSAGNGFLVGQALKKLMQLKRSENPRDWEKEAIGAASYVIMAIMWEQFVTEKCGEEKWKIQESQGKAP
jgi:hypothetical protein